MKNVFISKNPLLQHRLTMMRDKDTPVEVFRLLMKESGALLGYELAGSLQSQSRTIETPLEVIDAPFFNQTIVFVAILRAALGYVDGLIQYFPKSNIGHLGMYRDEMTLKPVWYYKNLPKNLGNSVVVLTDPMLATGGSILAGIEFLKEQGCTDNIRVASLIAAPEGVKNVHAKYPETPIHLAALDRQLNENGYILPGLGDAGDRQYGTM